MRPLSFIIIQCLCTFGIPIVQIYPSSSVTSSRHRCRLSCTMPDISPDLPVYNRPVTGESLLWRIWRAFVRFVSWVAKCLTVALDSVLRWYPCRMDAASLCLPLMPEPPRLWVASILLGPRCHHCRISCY